MKNIEIKNITIEVNTTEEPLTEEEKKKQQALEKQEEKLFKFASKFLTLAGYSFFISVLSSVIIALIYTLKVGKLMDVLIWVAAISLFIAVVSSLIAMIVMPYVPDREDYTPLSEKEHILIC